MIVDDRLEKKARNIGNTAEWINKSDDNLLTPQNIWDRIRPGMRVNKKIDLKLLILRNTNPTVLIAEKCANSLLVFCLLDLYFRKVVGKSSYILRLEVAYAGLFDLSIFARIRGFCHVGIEQLALLYFDLDLKKRATIFNGQTWRERQDSSNKYFGEGTYRSVLISLWSSNRAPS